MFWKRSRSLVIFEYRVTPEKETNMLYTSHIYFKPLADAMAEGRIPIENRQYVRLADIHTFICRLMDAA